jgi:hypothetical protein
MMGGGRKGLDSRWHHRRGRAARSVYLGPTRGVCGRRIWIHTAAIGSAHPLENGTRVLGGSPQMISTLKPARSSR